MHKLVFLDRDGTINVDNGFVHKVEDWAFTDRAAEALMKLQAAGFKLAIITNQSGIGHGMYTVADMDEVHRFMEKELEKNGVKLDAVAFCPHRRDGGCGCRKPEVGMAKQIEEKLGEIDYSASWTIGDKEADLKFGKALGTHTALIRSKYWDEVELVDKPDVIASTLYEVVERIV